jgi:hypothetical protein
MVAFYCVGIDQLTAGTKEPVSTSSGSPRAPDIYASRAAASIEVRFLDRFLKLFFNRLRS